MKDKNYLFVNPNNIYRLKYKDDNGKYIKTGYEKALRFFEENGIPMKYQYIILEMDHSFVVGDLGKDIFINKKFYIYDLDGSFYVNGKSFESDIPLYFYLNTKRDYRKRRDVIRFYDELDRYGYLDSYVKALSEFYRASLSKNNSKSVIYKNKVKKLR